MNTYTPSKFEDAAWIAKKFQLGLLTEAEFKAAMKALFA